MLPISAAMEAPILPANTKDRIIGESSIIVLLKITLIVHERGTMPDDW